MFEKGSGEGQLGQLDHLESPRWGLCHHVNYWQSGIRQTGVGKLFQNAPEEAETKTFELFEIKRTQIQQHVRSLWKGYFMLINFCLVVSRTQRKNLMWIKGRIEKSNIGQLISNTIKIIFTRAETRPPVCYFLIASSPRLRLNKTIPQWLPCFILSLNL